MPRRRAPVLTADSARRRIVFLNLEEVGYPSRAGWRRAAEVAGDGPRLVAEAADALEHQPEDGTLAAGEALSRQ
ncbi:MAG: hypothetical protein ACE5LL_08990 [Alphaproteobacteria bacterium]